MTTTIPATRAEALQVAEAEAARKFELWQFETEDGDNRDPHTGVAPMIPCWGVRDVDTPHDGRGGLVWKSPEGFQAGIDQTDVEHMLAIHRAEYVQALMEEWEKATGAAQGPTHQVIRLDYQEPDAPSDPGGRNRRRLEQLVALYDDAKARADAAAAELEEIKQGIKTEVRQLYPGQGDFTITSGALAHPLTLQRVVSRRFDTVGAKSVLTAEQYDALCKDSESWVLKAKKG